MKGINEKVAVTQSDKQLNLYSLDLKQVLTTVITKFIELLKKNNMLGVEILFRFPSREIKDQILSNYERSAPAATRKIGGGNDRKSVDNESNEGMVDLNNFDHMANSLNLENLNINDKEDGDDEAPVEKLNEQGFKWTQDKDEILINNYKQFESLGKKSCFSLLSQLIPGTTPKECYYRGKQLKLKSSNEEDARTLSRKLIGEASHTFTDKKVAIALQKFINAKIEKNQTLSKV